MFRPTTLGESCDAIGVCIANISSGVVMSTHNSAGLHSNVDLLLRVFLDRRHLDLMTSIQDTTSVK